MAVCSWRGSVAFYTMNQRPWHASLCASTMETMYIFEPLLVRERFMTGVKACAPERRKVTVCTCGETLEGGRARAACQLNIQ